MICSPSFLSCDFNKLESEIKSISVSKWIHFDVMDGRFVSNKTYDYNMVKLLKHISNQFFDVHLMVEKPEKIFDKYIIAGADLITFHYEATKQPKALIRAIKSKGIKVGVSIKPGTDITAIESLLPKVDLVLVMSVEPGKGGQEFIHNSLEKIKYLAEKRISNNYNYLIEVDGGVNFDTAKQVKDVGCDVVVVGSFIFNSDNRDQLIMRLKNV
ncbi:MAG: ribulose-phosphate 3-epimerase [Clostridiales bacterium]|nr:ribulose-phosphate 3-epimerase [Clostridiales bacterium]